MSVPAIHEDDVEALGLPGRELRWVVAAERLAVGAVFRVRDPGRARRQGPAGALASQR